MRYWLTTDTHFFHKKMHEYCGRPLDFEDIIFKNLIENVKDEDVLIHLGDICIGQDEKAHQTYIEPLKCKKWLIRGNHDKKTDTWYFNHGWDFVAKYVIMDVFGKQILLSHEPKVNVFNNIDINIHGHLHNNDNYETTKINKLIAIEYTNYQPILLRSVIEKKKL